MLLVCDPGGHLAELVALEDVWSGFSRIWVVPGGAGAHPSLPGERTIAARGPTRRSLVAFLSNLRLAWRVLRRTRPAVILTTGAAVAVPFAWLARPLGARVVHVECSGRVGVSLSGRLLRPVAHRFYVQWPETAAAVPRARYAGSVFFSEP